jgi:hypothetical protein
MSRSYDDARADLIEEWRTFVADLRQAWQRCRAAWAALTG